jgi:hypothetical protein
MTDQPSASVLDTWPTEQVPGLSVWQKSVSDIEPELRVRALVARTRRALVKDPTLDLVSALDAATTAVTPGDRAAEWMALKMIAGKQETALDRSYVVTAHAVRRLRLSYAGLAAAALRADEAVRAKADSQRTLNTWAIDILCRARALDPNDPIFEGRREESSSALGRVSAVAAALTTPNKSDAEKRAVDLLRPVAFSLRPVDRPTLRHKVNWAKPLDDALATQEPDAVESGTTVFDRAVEIAVDENTRLGNILRTLPPRPSRLARVGTHVKTKISMPGRVKLAPAGAHLNA